MWRASQKGRTLNNKPLGPIRWRSGGDHVHRPQRMATEVDLIDISCHP